MTQWRLIQFIEQRLGELDMKQAKLAELADINPATISRILGGKVDPDLDTLAKIAPHIGSSFTELYGLTSYPPLEMRYSIESDFPEVLDVARLMASMSEYERGLVLKFAKTIAGDE